MQPVSAPPAGAFRMRRVLSSCLTVLLLAAPAPMLAAGEFWLEPGRQRGGSGTREDPWRVDSAETFDERMRGIPANSIIHLGKGTFETYGSGAPDQKGFLVKSGWQVIGAGQKQTTIRLLGCTPDTQAGSGIGRMFFSGWGAGVENVVFRDFTADCNADGVRKRMRRDNITLEAINLFGRQITIQRIRAINAIGRRANPNANPEAFVIAVSPRDDNTEADGYLIEDCEVSRFAGGNCTGICLLGGGGRGGGRNGARGVIRNNRVLLNGGGGEFAFSAYGTADFRIENNESRLAARAFNWDSDRPGSGLVIVSNRFLRCTSFAINLGGGGDSIIERNIIELEKPTAVAFQISAKNERYPGARSWIIRDNVIRTRARGGIAVRFFRGEPVPGCVFENNQLDPALTVDPSARAFQTWRGNSTTRGRPVSLD